MEVLPFVVTLVLLTETPPVAADRARCRDIVARLGSASFQTRALASAELDALLNRDGPSKTQIRGYFRARAHHPDPEVARRIRDALEQHHQRYLNSLRPRYYTLLPTIDQMSSAGVPNRWELISHCHELVGPHLPQDGLAPRWDKWRRATQVCVAVLDEQGWTGDQIRDLLDQMVDQEALMHGREGHMTYYIVHLRPFDSISATRVAAALIRAYCQPKPEPYSESAENTEPEVGRGPVAVFRRAANVVRDTLQATLQATLRAGGRWLVPLW